jgi:hypothetical protein
MAAGNRLLEAQSLELKLTNEKENRPGLLKEIKHAQAMVDVRAVEYLESIRRCRVASTDGTSSNLRCSSVGRPGFLGAIRRPWRRQRSSSTDRLEQLCLH